MALPGDDLNGAEVEFSPDRALSAAQCVEGVGVDFFPRVSGTELEQYATDAEPHDGADFEQLQSDRIHLRLCPGSAFQPQPSQRFHQGVSQGGEVETELVALHLVG